MFDHVLKKALAETKKAPIQQTYRHAAILFDNRGNIISKGWNVSRQCFDKALIYGYPFPTIHSELMAFLKSKLSTLQNLNMLIIRTNKRGELRNSRPCSHCIHLLKKYDLSFIYYSTDDGEIKKERV